MPALPRAAAAAAVGPPHRPGLRGPLRSRIRSRRRGHSARPRVPRADSRLGRAGGRNPGDPRPASQPLHGVLDAKRLPARGVGTVLRGHPPWATRARRASAARTLAVVLREPAGGVGGDADIGAGGAFRCEDVDEPGSLHGRRSMPAPCAFPKAKLVRVSPTEKCYNLARRLTGECRFPPRRRGQSDEKNLPPSLPLTIAVPDLRRRWLIPSVAGNAAVARTCRRGPPCRLPPP